MVSDTTISILDNIEIGCRIEFLDQYATVRYIGPVDGHPSNWLGVEWDNPSRGKHDGSVAAVRYFQTSHPTAGSFIRPQKVQFGKDAIEAITSRYGKKESVSEEHVNQLKLLDLQKEINAPFLQMVGFDKVNEKQSNFKELQIISLRLQFVNGPGEPGEFAQLCPNITELDLSKNLLYKWTDIFDICDQLSSLKWLNVSENRLQFPDNIEHIVYPSLTSLICGQMQLNWFDIVKLSKIFPRLKELRAPDNCITQIEMPDNCLVTLKVLDVAGNNIQKWDEINKLGVLRNLEQLIVLNIGITDIRFPDCEIGAKIDLFVNLKQLVISENLINNWESISELNKLSVLEDLKFLKNPILDVDKSTTNVQFIIARIEKLNTLNGTLIKADERKGAEYDYIKKHGLEWFRVEKNPEEKAEFLKKHPRYLQLLEMHGIPEESELTFQSATLKSSLTAVNIEFENVVLTKRLPSSMQLQKLIMLIQKLFKLNSRPTLYYVSSSLPDVEIEMRDEFKDIGFYSIEENDKICVRLSK